MSTRSELIGAAKELLWERGFESTSPGAVLERSGAGQGSLYHHFRGKSDLAVAALSEVGAEMRAGVESILRHPDRSALENVIAYLTIPREAIKGCRLGRFANESTIVSNPDLLKPIRDYFVALQGLIAGALADAQAAGDFDKRANSEDIAIALIATVQGGYVLTRIFEDGSYMDRATNAAIDMLRAFATTSKRKAK